MTLPVLVVAPVLTVLHSEYGIGGVDGLKAPQATLFASLMQGLFGDQSLPYNMVGLGVVFGLSILIADWLLQSGRSGFRLYVMPVAVGVYLPITLSVPIVLGGLVRYFVQKHKAAGGETADSQHDRGVLLSSGLVAGEAIMGVLLAVLTFVGVKMGSLDVLPLVASEFLSLAALLALVFYLYKVAKARY